MGLLVDPVPDGYQPPRWARVLLLWVIPPVVGIIIAYCVWAGG